MFKVLRVDQNRWLNKYQSIGSEGFYKLLLRYAITRIAENQDQKEVNTNDIQNLKSSKKNSTIKQVNNSSKISPEIELLTYYNHFLQLYRREKNEVFLEIAKCFRRASYKIYRVLLKQDLVQRNNKFFNLVG